MSDSAFKRSVEALTLGRDLRVWSIIVTLFGDLAQGPEDRISGALMSSLVEMMGIKPEAMRVALHRLRKDGWIESHKTGRRGEYSLTAYGRAESAAVTPLIYAPSVKLSKDWFVAVTASMSQAERKGIEASLKKQDYFAIASGVYLGNGAAPIEDGLFVLSGRSMDVPDWLREALSPEKLCGDYAAFEVALERISTEATSALEVATLRALIVHNWRRLVLRHPHLPADFFTKDWRGIACRKRVHTILSEMGRPELPTLEGIVSL